MTQEEREQIKKENVKLVKDEEKVVNVKAKTNDPAEEGEEEKGEEEEEVKQHEEKDRRWSSDPRPQPQKYSKLMFLIQLSRYFIWGCDYNFTNYMFKPKHGNPKRQHLNFSLWQDMFQTINVFVYLKLLVGEIVVKFPYSYCICLNWLCGALVGARGSDFIGQVCTFVF